MMNDTESTNEEHTEGTSKTYKIIRIRGDGNCLFRATSMFKHGKANLHRQIRKKAVQYIQQHWEEVEAHLEDTDHPTKEEYCEHMGKNGTYGTSVEILAISETQKINVVIYKNPKPIAQREYTPENVPEKVSLREHAQTMHLLLSGNNNAAHYELLKPTRQKPKEQTQDKDGHDWQDATEGREEESEGDTNSEIDERIDITADAEKNDSPRHSLQPGPTNKERQNKSQKHKWTKDECREILWCHYYTIETTGTANLKTTFETWKARNPNSKLNMSANTLATQRRYIENKKKISDEEKLIIQEEVRKHVSHELTEGAKSKQENETLEEDETEPSPTDPDSTSETQREEDTETIDEDKLPEIIARIKIKCDELNNPDSRTRLPKIQTKTAINAIRTTNAALAEIVKDQTLDITDLNTLTYAAAVVVLEETGERIEKPNKKTNNGNPKWQERIEKTIQQFRRELSYFAELKKPTISKKVRQKGEILKKKYGITTEQKRTEVIETIKQKLQAKAYRLRRYKNRAKGYKQNKAFHDNKKALYNQICGKQVKAERNPERNQVLHYWKGIWENEVKHNDKAKWIREVEDELNDVNEMTWNDIQPAEVTDAIKKTANWKAPGPDGIQNFWLKYFKALHGPLATAYNNMINGSTEIPAWHTQGITNLIPKSKQTKEPKNFRPITCLSTMYKNLTAILTNRIYEHLMEEKLYPEEQKGNVKKSMGCKDQLLISKMIAENCKKRKKSLSIAWIDYRKAFDTVPHSWIIKVMQMYKINRRIIEFTEQAMKKWTTSLTACIKGERIAYGKIEFKRGIFQGDSLSPLLFCMALFPISKLLNKTQTGHQMQKGETKINHLLYMDDLKLIGQDDEELVTQIKTTKQFSDDIKMEFGLDKCAKVSIEDGKITKKDNIEVEPGKVISELEAEETYKYLGVEEANEIKDGKVKNVVRKEYYRRVRNIAKSELTGKNKMTSIGTLAIPILRYGFGIIDWTDKEIKQMDRKTRKILTSQGIHHPKADVHRLYVDRDKGGRGLSQVEEAYKSSILGMAEYLERKKDESLMSQVVQHDLEKPPSKSIQKRAQKILEELEKLTQAQNQNLRKTTKRKELIKKSNEDRWKEKPMHGQFPRELEKPWVNKAETYSWLKRGKLKGETEATMIAIQDQAIATNYYRKRILKEDIDEKCRLCGMQSETIYHLSSGCSILAKKEYITRHDKICSRLHYNVCKEFGITTKSKWYEHTPEAVTESGTVTILYNHPIHTDRFIPANKPDLVIRDKNKRECLIIDVSVPMDNNVQGKQAEKLLKYKDLQIEISRVWNVKTTVIPIIIGAHGTIGKKLSKYLEAIPGCGNKYLIGEIQDLVILETCRIIRKTI